MQVSRPNIEPWSDCGGFIPFFWTSVVTIFTCASHREQLILRCFSFLGSIQVYMSNNSDLHLCPVLCSCFSMKNNERIMETFKMKEQCPVFSHQNNTPAECDVRWKHAYQLIFPIEHSTLTLTYTDGTPGTPSASGCPSWISPFQNSRTLRPRIIPAIPTFLGTRNNGKTWQKKNFSTLE